MPKIPDSGMHAPELGLRFGWRWRTRGGKLAGVEIKGHHISYKRGPWRRSTSAVESERNLP
jgi:hypothetical protein